MRDLTSSWPAAPDWPDAELKRGGVIARSIAVSSQHLVSGNLAAFAAAAGLRNEGVGAFGETSGACYALRLARDRMLVVGAPQAATSAGWHAEGYAVTDVSALYHVFEFQGDGVDTLLGEAMFIDPKAESSSAATMFAGQYCVVHLHEGRLRLHVERGLAPYIWQWLEARD